MAGLRPGQHPLIQQRMEDPPEGRAPVAIRYRSVSKVYPRAARPAVDAVEFDVGQAEFVVFLGPSGCGKTTLLKMTNRLIEPSSGTIEFDGTDVRGMSATQLRRRMGYVIQQVGLFPHMTVEANVATVPRLLGWSRSRIRDRIDELLELVGLEPENFRDRYPHQLSGGQQQRVGLARALAADPNVMLMDEPFGAIDAITRERLQTELVGIQRRVRKTVLFVTHDVEEALRLADKLLIMRDGRVVQYGPPVEVLANPADPFVRQLLSTDDVLRELGVIPVVTVARPGEGDFAWPTITADSSVREALSRLLVTAAKELVVLGPDGTPVGTVSMEDIRSLSASKAAPEAVRVG